LAKLIPLQNDRERLHFASSNSHLSRFFNKSNGTTHAKPILKTKFNGIKTDELDFDYFGNVRRRMRAFADAVDSR
jgi:hypothetical protein